MAKETVVKEPSSSCLCQECNEDPSLYQCPRCSRKTCSLTCCKAHKDRTGCSGKRNRTQFLPLARMSDQTIQSDYHFLEDVLKAVDGGKRLLKDVGATLTQQPHQKNSHDMRHTEDESSVPLHPMLRIQERHDEEEPSNKRQRTSIAPKWQQLVQQADLRGTTLVLMPPGMQRHVSNTTWYHSKTNILYWKVDFVIHQDNNSTRIISIPKLDENANVTEELKKPWPQYTNEHHLLLKRLPCPSNQPTYVELDRQTSTLKSALRNQTVIEYPTIELVPTTRLSQFPLSIEELG